jgi:MtfA peptidase
MPPELGFALLGAAVLAALIGVPWWARKRRQQQGARPFPTAWRRLLQRQFPLYQRLPHPLQRRLQAMVQVFVAEKPVIGCQGLHVTDDMRVLIAAQACLLVLELHSRGSASSPHQPPVPEPYPELREILLYPTAFVVQAQQHQPGGVIRQGREARLGESWQEGRVVLSWSDSQRGAAGGEWARHPSTEAASNVVMHEFAHQLDQETGAANGAPALGRTQSATWVQVFQRAYDELRWLTDAGEATLIDPYGATAPEEFFAVATETFFMQPRALASQHPELYGQLQQFFRLDPQAW